MHDDRYPKKGRKPGRAPQSWVHAKIWFKDMPENQYTSHKPMYICFNGCEGSQWSQKVLRWVYRREGANSVH